MGDIQQELRKQAADKLVELERKDFEDWHIEHCKSLGMTDEDDLASELDRNEDGNYIYLQAEIGWDAWQARAAKSAKES